MSGHEKEREPSLDYDPSEEEVDEELMALAPPPPSVRQAVFVLGVLVLTIVMMVWFFPEARFLARGLSGPVDLGDAIELDVDTLTPHSYVSVDGLPMINEKLVYNEGVKWFALSDTERKMFPLAGQPNLFIQWTVPDEHKVYKDPKSEPGHFAEPASFEGHLLPRSELGANYDRLWVFFDCLDVHPISRCSYCLGRDSFESCREIFTCAERNTLDECSAMITRSNEGIEKELAELSGADQAKKKELEALLASKREQELAVLSMRLEEVSVRLSKYAAAAKGEKAKEVAGIRADALAIRLAELETQATEALGKVKSLNEEDLKKSKASFARLTQLREDEPKKVEELKTLQGFLDVADGLRSFERRLAWVNEKITGEKELPAETFATWSPNPEERDGKNILAGLGAMEEILAARFGKSPAATVETPDAGVDAGADGGPVKPSDEQAADTGSEGEEAPIEQTVALVSSNLAKLIGRSADLRRKVMFATPSDNPEFSKWATSSKKLLHFCRGKKGEPCKAPKGLRNDEIIASLSELEKMLADVRIPETGDEGEAEKASLEDRFSTHIDALDEIRKEIKALEMDASVTALEVAMPLEDLGRSIEEAGEDPEKIAKVEKELDLTKELMLTKGVFSVQLKGVKGVLEATGNVLEPGKIKDLEARTAEAGQGLDKADWVLLDGEVPMDRIWVIFIYLVLLVMAIVNIRKLLRFIAAWRS